MKKLLTLLVLLLIGAIIITSCSSTSTALTGSSTPTATTPILTAPSATTTAATTSTTTKPATTTPAATTATTTTPATTTAPGTGITPTYGGVLKYITTQMVSTPIGYNPETTGSSIFSMQQTLQPLIREQADGSFTPTLATSYDINSDPNNASITFYLRKGVKFHDGSDFNAQAVKWNLENTKATGVNVGTTQFWKSFEVLDDYTIKVNFTTYQNRLIRSFADTVGFLSSPTAFQKNGIDWMRWHMVGTGPFMQTDFQRDVSLTTAKNTNYWDTGKPYLDGLQILYVTDELTRVALFKSGGGNIVEVTPRMANDLQTAGYKILSQDAGANVLVPDSLNSDSPWSNLKVRQAAEYAIDKEGLTKALGYGYQKTAYQINPPTSIGFDPNLASRKYDVAKAKQLLSDAGYPNGFKTRIIAQSNTDRNIITGLQANLAAVGITADLEIVEAAKYTSYVTGTWKNALIYNSFLQWPNPNTAFVFYFGVPKSTWFQSLKKPDNWLDVATASLTTLKMDSAAVQKSEDALYNDVTVIPLNYGVYLWGVSSNFQGGGLGTRGYGTYWNPDNAWLSK